MLSNKPSIPRSFNAEIKWNLAKSREIQLAVDIAFHLLATRSSLMPSHLLTATTKARPASKSKTRNRRILVGDILLRIQHQNSNVCRLNRLHGFDNGELFPPASSTLPRRRTPAVSMMVNGLPSFKNRYGYCHRVVPAISKAITSSPRMAFTKVDLPTFGRPITAKTGCFASSSSFSGPGRFPEYLQSDNTRHRRAHLK